MISDYLSLVKYEITVKCPRCQREHTASKKEDRQFLCECNMQFRIVNEYLQTYVLKMGEVKANTSGEA